MAQIMEPLSKLPRYLIPCYFDATISVISRELVCSAISHMGKYDNSLNIVLVSTIAAFNRFVRNGSTLVHSLALGHVQLFSRCNDAPLPVSGGANDDAPAASLAAGLPHFSTGAMRCWGRDTFISLRGLMLVTGQYKHAR